MIRRSVGQLGLRGRGVGVVRLLWVVHRELDLSYYIEEHINLPIIVALSPKPYVPIMVT